MNSRGGRGLLSPLRSAFWPEGWIVTGIRLLVSVTRITRAVRSPTPEMRPTRPIPSIVAQPSRMPSRAPTFKQDRLPERAATVGHHHAGHMGQLRVKPHVVQVQKPGVLLLQLQGGLFPGLHLLQLALQFLVLLVDAGVGLEVVQHPRHQRDRPHRPVKVRHHGIDQRRAEAFHAGAVDPPEEEQAQKHKHRDPHQKAAERARELFRSDAGFRHGSAFGAGAGTARRCARFQVS